MDALSQLDVTAPDHVSVITRDGKVTISVLKDGTSVTLGFPIRSPWIETPPQPPMQPSRGRMNGPVMSKEQGLAYLKELAERDRKETKTTTQIKPVGALSTTHVRYRGPVPKLTPSQVREIKLLINDEKYMGGWTSKTQAYQAIGRRYNVTGCAISNIARGIAWSDIKA